ncbi:FecR family protein [Hymenobacter sp. GOD-10R]|uniref:FecR family protein n=1 Tax=Hymenobacter sp. GOD-10R TaxID=3093922 RepID=UPI002D7875AD|nr:FecR domain-containing protein [Hymenobacter sp. GOD-10R]WRQ26843.1 FecR domain-containing protein [Hymenobacter sp. GOD-10R]
MEQEELYLLITRYLARQTSAEENDWLATWVAQSPDHERMFEQLKLVWQGSKAPAANAKTAAALRNVKKRLTLPAPVPTPPSLPRRPKYHLVALVLLILVVAGGVWYLAAPPSPQPYTLRQTPAGQKQTIRLADGSRVTLAPQSQLRYPVAFDGAYRDVYLEGEAFFEVSKDARHPFRVHSGPLVTQVLGTKFNVSTFGPGQLTTVSLVEGKVQVLDQHARYLLTPGQQLRADLTTGRVHRQLFDPEQVSGWRYNKLIFRNEKLADAAPQIERLYNVKLVFADSATAAARLWATFDNEPLSAVLSALQLAGSLTSRREGHVIYLTRQVPPNRSAVGRP